MGNSVSKKGAMRLRYFVCFYTVRVIHGCKKSTKALLLAAAVAYCMYVVGRLALNRERSLLFTRGSFLTTGKLSFPPCI